MKTSPEILIAGAGPTGLVLAICLARRGVPLRIVDRRSGPGQASRAMAVQARTLEFYQMLGIADRVVAGGIKMETLRIREAGKQIATLSLKDLGAGLSPYPFALCYPQDDHERFLVEHLQSLGVSVEWDTELQEFRDTGDGVLSALAHGGETEKCHSRFLCGCDGARSTVRHALGIDFPGGTYDQNFYVADVKVRPQFGASSGATSSSSDPTSDEQTTSEVAPGVASNNTDILVNLGPRTFGLMLPVRSSGMQRLIGAVPESLQPATISHSKTYAAASSRSLAFPSSRSTGFRPTTFITESRRGSAAATVSSRATPATSTAPPVGRG